VNFLVADYLKSLGCTGIATQFTEVVAGRIVPQLTGAVFFVRHTPELCCNISRTIFSSFSLHLFPNNCALTLPYSEGSSNPDLELFSQDWYFF